MNTSAWDASPEEALRRLRSLPADVPALIDLDETLFLENSSERFVDTARPALLARLLLLFLDRLRPWRWLGGDRHRDLVRIRALQILLPWTSALWRRRCADLAQRFANRELIEVLGSRPSLVVTFGYRPVVEPLVAALLPGVKLVASALNRHDRDVGKPAMLREQAPEFALPRCVAISDSLDDADVFAASTHPLRVVWPQARVRRALMQVYLPLFYVEKIRRPGMRYFFRGVVQDELIVLLLAAMPLAVAPLSLGIGLTLLCLSFWCIYEQGYVDNDRLSRRYETENVRPETDEVTAYGSPYVPAVLWSAVLAAPGLWLTARGTGGEFRHLVPVWAAVLAATAAYFTLYNRLARRGRIAIFSGLHALRAFSLATVAAVTLPGFFMLCSNVVTRQMEDYVRKNYDRGAATPDLFIVKTLLYLSFTLGYAAVFRIGDVTFWFAASLMLVYGLVRARAELAGFLRELRWVWSRPGR